MKRNSNTAKGRVTKFPAMLPLSRNRNDIAVNIKPMSPFHVEQASLTASAQRSTRAWFADKRSNMSPASSLLSKIALTSAK